MSLSQNLPADMTGFDAAHGGDDEPEYSDLVQDLLDAVATYDRGLKSKEQRPTRNAINWKAVLDAAQALDNHGTENEPDDDGRYEEDN